MEPMRFLVTDVESSSRISGRLISGQINNEDSVVTAPSGHQTSILSIEANGAECSSIEADADLNLNLTYSVTLNPGDILAAADLRPEFTDQFEAQIAWLSEQELLPGRTYRLHALGGESEAFGSRLK